MSYSYYSDGLRASKTIGSNTTKYYYDGDNVINETLNGSNYATNVLGVNGYISRKQNGTIGYLFKDAHGDVLAAYSDTATKIADYSYTAWGETQTANETSNFTNNPLRYCGEYYDYESGMTYLRARYYDSEIKRFISEDPIRDGVNWYVYAGNNPVMFVDPRGLVPVMLRYIVEKNYGKVTWNSTTQTATIYIAGYKPLDVSGTIVNGRLLVDSDYLKENFALSEDRAIHKEWDMFDSADDAAIAFSLMYYDKAVNERQEYGASIDAFYSQDGDKFWFTNIRSSAMRANKSVNELSDEERKKVEIAVDESSYAQIHIHWDKNGNPFFSRQDPDAAFYYSMLREIYLLNSRREILSLYRSDYEHGYTEGYKKFDI